MQSGNGVVAERSVPLRYGLSWCGSHGWVCLGGVMLAWVDLGMAVAEWRCRVVLGTMRTGYARLVVSAEVRSVGAT